MSDFLIKLFSFLIDKFASASRYIVAGFAGAILLFSVFVYFFGHRAIEPYIDYYLMTKINAYFDDQATLLANAKQVDPKIRNVATDKLKTITASLYDEVDAVYPISSSFTRSDLEKLGTNPLSIPMYVYADLEKHRVFIYLNRRQLSFDYKVCFNGSNSCKERNNNLVGEEITEGLKKSPLRPANAGEKSERLAYPPNIHLIEIRPLITHIEQGEVAEVEGYVMVKRANQEHLK